MKALPLIVFEQTLGEAMFHVGDEVVYPAHGVAVVKEIIEKKIKESTKIFFKLEFKFKNVTILIPKEKLEQIGVRFVSPLSEVESMLYALGLEEDLFGGKCKEGLAGSWNRRQKDYQSRLESGSLREIARAYRDLKLHSEKKALSFGEKGLLDMAEDLLLQEVATATKMGHADVLQKLRSPFNIKSEDVTTC